MHRFLISEGIKFVLESEMYSKSAGRDTRVWVDEVWRVLRENISRLRHKRDLVGGCDADIDTASCSTPYISVPIRSNCPKTGDFSKAQG